jgi:hypothetical protein
MLRRGSATGRVNYDAYQGRCAAAALADSAAGRAPSERQRWLSSLRRAIRALEKHGGAKAHGLALLFRAVLELDGGSPAAALDLLRRVLASFQSADMGMYAAACQRRLGELAGGDEGRDLVARSEAFMRQQNVKDLDAYSELHCPGFVRSR